MYKWSSLLVLLSVSCAPLKAMESEKQSNIIPGSSFYHILPAYGKVFYCQCTDESKERTIQKVDFEGWNDEQQKLLDSKIDPQAPKALVNSAEIYFNLQVGRVICYFDKAGKTIFAHSYSGSADIRSLKDSIYTIKPASLLENIQSVKEDDLILGLVQYHKKTITYDQSGKAIEQYTAKHKALIAARYASIGLMAFGASYFLYTAYQVL